MIRSLLLWASENRWFSRTLPQYAFVRRAVERFMPGEELEDALRAARKLHQRHAMSALVTVLGENVEAEAEAEEAADHYREVARTVAKLGLDAEISLKPTHLGLDFGLAVAERNIRRVAEAAEERGSTVWLDMEYSRYVDATLQLYRRLLADHPRVGVCLQSYLRRTPGDLESLIPLGASIRLVKGAYAEPPKIALPTRGEVDSALFRQATRLLRPDARDAGVRLGLATHDPSLIRRVGGWAADRGVEADAWEHQMLYGIAQGEQRRLAATGRKVRVLISYGTNWFAWYARRLAERPANIGFLLRNILPGRHFVA